MMQFQYTDIFSHCNLSLLYEFVVEVPAGLHLHRARQQPNLRRDLVIITRHRHTFRRGIPHESRQLVASSFYEVC
jgi:hypothetical protein